MQTASPISAKHPVWSSSGVRGNNAPPTIPNAAATRSTPHQAANAPPPKPSVERPRRLRPSTAASRLPTRGEAPRALGRSFGAAAEGPNVTATGRKEAAGGQGSLQRGPGLPRRAQARGSPQPRRGPPRPSGRSGLCGARARGHRTERSPATPPGPGPAAPEERPEPPARRGASARPAPPKTTRHRSAVPLAAAAGRAHRYPAHTSASASPRHRPQAASA